MLTHARTTYNSADNKTRDWESATRLTRPKGSLIDGVGIVAILEKSGGPEILLQKQYRPPIDKVCIEVPAGLVDEGETAEICAVRELKEETGYVGKVIEGPLGKTPVMFNGKSGRDQMTFDSCVSWTCTSTDCCDQIRDSVIRTSTWCMSALTCRIHRTKI